MKKDKFIEKNKVYKDLHSKREIVLLELLGIWGLAGVNLNEYIRHNLVYKYTGVSYK